MLAVLRERKDMKYRSGANADKLVVPQSKLHQVPKLRRNDHLRHEVIPQFLAGLALIRSWKNYYSSWDSGYQSPSDSYHGSWPSCNVSRSHAEIVAALFDGEEDVVERN